MHDNCEIRVGYIDLSRFPAMFHEAVFSRPATESLLLIAFESSSDAPASDR